MCSFGLCIQKKKKKMLAQVLVHMKVILTLHGQLDQQIDQMISASELSSPISPDNSVRSWEESSVLAKGDALYHRRGWDSYVP